MHLEKSSGTTVVKTEVASNSAVGFEIKKTGSTTQNWRIVDGQTANGKLEIYDVTDSRSVMTFDGAGNVGIGITSPTQKLDVRGGSGAGTLTHAIFTGTSSRGLEIRTRSDSSGGQNSGTAEINSADSEGTGGDLAFSSNGNIKMFIDEI